MIKRAVLVCLGCAFTLLGLIGLLVPVMPGILFLAGAAVCFSAASSRFQGRLERHPAFRRLRNRWQAGRGLPLLRRARLAFWLTADAALRALPGKTSAR